MKVASPAFVPCGFGPAISTTLLPPLSKERMTAPSSPRSLAGPRSAFRARAISFPMAMTDFDFRAALRDELTATGLPVMSVRYEARSFAP